MCPEYRGKCIVNSTVGGVNYIGGRIQNVVKRTHTHTNTGRSRQTHVHTFIHTHTYTHMSRERERNGDTHTHTHAQLDVNDHTSPLAPETDRQIDRQADIKTQTYINTLKHI